VLYLSLYILNMEHQEIKQLAKAIATELKALDKIERKHSKERELFLSMYKDNPKLNRSQAAKVCGVSRQTIHTWMREA